MAVFLPRNQTAGKQDHPETVHTVSVKSSDELLETSLFPEFLSRSKNGGPAICRICFFECVLALRGYDRGR
jgi:hypothetical protein